MVFRKPYAFLIKHFRLIHLIITGLLVYIVSNIQKIYSFILSCISEQVNRYNALDYINYNIYIYLGIGIYALNTIFCLITLPIEINASKRAYKMLVSSGELDLDEAKQMKKVLDAAAWTYVAALVTSILSLLRLLLFVVSVRGRD